MSDHVLFVVQHSTTSCLPYQESRVVSELVLWHLQVEWGWTLADPPRCVLVGAVAGTVVASKVSLVGYRHTTKMSADPQQYQPLRFLDPLIVMLGVTQ